MTDYPSNFDADDREHMDWLRAGTGLSDHELEVRTLQRKLCKTGLYRQCASPTCHRIFSLPKAHEPRGGKPRKYCSRRCGAYARAHPELKLGEW